MTQGIGMGVLLCVNAVNPTTSYQAAAVESMQGNQWRFRGVGVGWWDDCSAHRCWKGGTVYINAGILGDCSAGGWLCNLLCIGGWDERGWCKRLGLRFGCVGIVYKKVHAVHSRYIAVVPVRE